MLSLRKWGGNMIAERIKELFPNDYQDKIYIGELPTDINVCVAIVEAGGPHGNYFGKQQLDEPYVKIVVRHPEYPLGYNLIKACKTLLSSYAEIDPFGLVLIGDIMYFGRDEKRRNMWQLTYKVFSYVQN